MREFVRFVDRLSLWTGHAFAWCIVILTIAHLDHCPENAALANLRALCQRCHLTYDRRTRLARREPMLFQDI